MNLSYRWIFLSSKLQQRVGRRQSRFQIEPRNVEDEVVIRWTSGKYFTLYWCGKFVTQSLYHWVDTWVPAKVGGEKITKHFCSVPINTHFIWIILKFMKLKLKRRIRRNKQQRMFSRETARFLNENLWKAYLQHKVLRNGYEKYDVQHTCNSCRARGFISASLFS